MATNQEIVAAAQQLYVSYYGRPADPQGLAFWVDFFTETDDVDAALVAFGDSDEFLAIVAANPTSEDLINQLYQFMFNRDAEPEGLAFYSDLLESGQASLASIALDIANGAQNDDRTTLDNKIAVANDFTGEIESTEAPYTANDIPAAQALLATVDDTDASVSAARSEIPGIVENLNGIITLTDATPSGNFSTSSVGVTVTLDGDDSETAFDVTLSGFDDTVIFEEYLSAEISGGNGTDTADFSEADGAYTISLDIGTFSADEDGDSLPDFSGTLTSIESVIGSDEDDTVNGSDAAERFDGGGGADTLRGGAGADTFVYEDQSDLVGETIDGQSGTDVLEFTGDNIDLTAAVAGLTISSIETLSLSNIESESNVSLALDSAGLGPEAFSLISGSDATDTITTGSGDFSATVLNSIEVVSASVDITVNKATLTDVNIAQNSVGGGQITAAAAGVYDLSGTTLLGWDLLNGSSATGDIWVLNQSQIDSILDDTTTKLFGTDMDDVAGSATQSNDILRAFGSLDLTRITGGLNVTQVDFGTASLIEIDETQLGAGLAVITGSGETGTLILNDDGDNAIDITGLELDGIANLELDGSAPVALTLGGDGFTGVSAVNGADADLTIGVTTTVDFTDSTLTDFDTITFAAAGGSVQMSQANIDHFEEWGTGLGADTLEFVMLGSSLNLSAVDFDDAFAAAGGDLLVTGSDANDTVRGSVGDDGGALGFTFNLGKGNDTFNGEDKTEAVGAIVVNGEDGDDTINLGAFSAAGTQTANGGAGDDRLVAGDATDTLTGGAGDDTFTVAMNQLGVTTDFGATDTDEFRLDININGTTTAFSDILVGGRLPVLQINTNVGTATTTTGTVENIAANRAIGDGTVPLQTLVNTAAARAYLTGLDNSSALLNSTFVLFATNASNLIAYIITADTAQTGAITAGEITSTTIATLGAGGAMAESDLIIV